MGDTSGKVWIYHERQQDLLCGQHALNNLIQESEFSPETLALMAHQLDELELAYMAQNNEGGINSKEYKQRINEGSGNVDAHGNFSIQVLRSALQKRFNIELPNIREDGIKQQEPTTMEGFICNKQAHWFAIRKVNGRYWNLNSTKERPELISHFNVATEIETLIKDGYSVFCVSNKVTLPPPCLDVQEMERRKSRQLKSVNGNWWRESDLLSGKGLSSGQNGSAGGDPWKNVGSGMRLDGKQNTPALPAEVAGALTEEEQLQFAMMSSLQQQQSAPAPAAAEIADVTVPPEPAAGTAGSVRIQFRLPSKPRLVRRFMATDSVAVVLSFCKEQEGGKSLDLRYGFPPKDLKALADQTIGDAKLAGESIQGRCI